MEYFLARDFYVKIFHTLHSSVEVAINNAIEGFKHDNKGKYPSHTHTHVYIDGGYFLIFFARFIS